MPIANFREAGDGAAVICLHSSASSSGQWRPLMDRLAPHFRVLAVDLYGYGGSPPWPKERTLSLTDEVALLEPVFDAAGGPVHLIGHSYGGAVALMAALANAGRVRSLVLIEPVLFALLLADDVDQSAAQEITAVRRDTVAALARGDHAASAARFIDYWMGPGAWAATPERRREAAATAMGKVGAEWPAVFDEPTPLAAFAALDMPALSLTGSESPQSSRGVARLLAATLPRVSSVELQGVGHLGPITHPDEVNAVIETYLRRLG